MRAPLIILICALPLGATAQEAPINWTCTLDILCPDTGACRDWDQQITIVEDEGDWRVHWNQDLPSEYQLIADFPPAEDAVEQVRVRSLLYANERNQSTQMVTFDSIGRVVVSGHQPQAGTRIVSGIGTCEPGE